MAEGPQLGRARGGHQPLQRREVRRPEVLGVRLSEDPGQGLRRDPSPPRRSGRESSNAPNCVDTLRAIAPHPPGNGQRPHQGFDVR